MKNNVVPFTTLQRVLEGLGFVRKKVGGPQVVFEHVPSHTLFLFRAYKPRDQVNAADLIEVRKILDERGLLEPEALEELLHQPSPSRSVCEGALGPAGSPAADEVR